MKYSILIKGFTLAEVLITVGVIGVVAAMTLPGLVNKYKKIVVVNKLKKFYTVMTQAIKLEEVEKGDLEYWMPDCETQSGCLESWFDEHLAKHIKTIKNTHLSGIYGEVAFNDGSGFTGYVASKTIIYFMYCTELKYCGAEQYDGMNSFLFTIAKNPRNDKYQFLTSLATYQTYSRKKLLDLCTKGNHDNANIYNSSKRHACARLIEYDGWEIKDDYPWMGAKQTTN